MHFAVLLNIAAPVIWTIMCASIFEYEQQICFHQRYTLANGGVQMEQFDRRCMHDDISPCENKQSGGPDWLSAEIRFNP